MAYEILRSDGTVLTNIPDGTADDTTTSINLIGKNFAGYGLLQNENFVHLLENFAGTTPPESPSVGQFWYDKNQKVIKYRHIDDTWKTVGASTVSATHPANPNIGDYWWNSSTTQLFVYNGSAWTLIGPLFNAQQGETGALPLIIRDSDGSSRVVLKFVINNTITAIYSKEQEDFTVHPDDKIIGFYENNGNQLVRPGMTLANLGLHSTSGYAGISKNTVWGTTENSLRLNNRSASDYLRVDEDSGPQTVSNGVTFDSFVEVGGNIEAVNHLTQDIGSSSVKFGNVYARNFIGNIVGSVSTVLSISNHTTDDLPEGNVNLYWNTARAEANKKYIDDNDYLNSDPMAGVLNENYVPLYADYKFSLQPVYSSSFLFTDNQNFEAVFFHATTTTNIIKPFRAYRFKSTDPLIYDADPIAVNFTVGNEYITRLVNIGTNFAYFKTSGGRKLLAKTNGSSKSSTWTLFADVSSIAPNGTNFFLMTDPSGDRILKITQTPSLVKLDVYDSALTLLRTVDLFQSSEVSTIDHANQGRSVGTDRNLPWEYMPHDSAFAFTWNKFTENFLMKLVGWFVLTDTNSASVLTHFGTTISWSIPRSWLLNGTGSPTNQIPTKPTGYRYHKLPDNTWDTENGGMGVGLGTAGYPATVVTDEYAKKIRVTCNSTWSLTGFDIFTLTNSFYKTIGNNLTREKTETVLLPDASPWSKEVKSSVFQIIDNNVLFYALSNKFGLKNISANFSTSAFLSSSGNNNDTLKLDPLTYSFDETVPGGNELRDVGTTVVTGQPIYYRVRPGQQLQIITVVNGQRVYTNTGFTLPQIPNSVNNITSISVAGPVVYNGDTNNKKFWVPVGVGSTNNRLFYIAEYSNNIWGNLYGPFLQTEIAAGQTNRSDSFSQWYIDRGTPLLTENGRFLQSVGVPVVGGTSFYQFEFNVNSKDCTVHGYNKFPISGPYGSTGFGYYGWSFGYSSTFGYYFAEGLYNQSVVAITSSKDVKGLAAEITEDDWFNNTGTRHVMYLSAEPATGLFVYLKEFPIFVGGYLTSIPESTVAVEQNKTNYIYAIKTAVNRTGLEILVSTDFLPNSFDRVNLGTVITNNERVISATSNRIRSTYTTQEIDAKFSQITNATGQIPLIPVGLISLWSGTGTNIPSGWKLCDGHNGTPDLRDRFVVGAGSTYAVGATGGSANAIVVAHTHTISGSTGTESVDHSHSFAVTSASGGDHAHLTGMGLEVNPFGATAARYGYADAWSSVRTAHAGATSYDSYTSTASGHTHSVSGSTGGRSAAHTHGYSGTTASAGSADTGANLPPYYALCYIMYTGTL